MNDPVYVVGGGLAGLATAAHLGRAGIASVVLERRREPGGRATTQVLDGFALTEGAHALYLGGPGVRILRALGIDPPGGEPDVAHGRVVRAGGLHRSPFGSAILTTSLLGIRERASAARLLAGLAFGEPQKAAGMSASEWIEAQSGGPRVHELLRALTRLSTYAGGLDELSGEVAVLQLRTAARKPVRYLDGGWASLVTALRSAAEAAGAEIRCAVTVEEVTEGPAVRIAGGAVLPARAVVLAGLAPRAAARLTGRPVAAPGPPVRAACLDVALTSLPRPENAWTLTLDEPLYVSAYSHVARLAPGDGAVVHVVGHLGAAEDRAVTRDGLEAALDRAQPGWRERLVHANFLPRMTVVTAAPAPGVRLADRPGIDALGVPGVLLAGDWVGPEGWLADATLASAAAAAQRIAGRGGAERTARSPAPAAA